MESRPRALPESAAHGDSNLLTNGFSSKLPQELASPISLDYGDPEAVTRTTTEDYEDEESDYSSDDEIQYCDCIAAALAQSLPGTPGKKGVVPYTSIYETQTQARKRGYWIPGVPVNAKITKVERNTDDGVHFINAYLYTIELEHGKFKWVVVRNYKDFTVLHNRLMAHRAAERIRAPVRRAQERFDSMLETVGVGAIPEHKEDCPYYRSSSHRRGRRRSRLEVLERTADALEASPGSAPLATIESPSSGGIEPNAHQHVHMAVQSGILHDDETVTSEGSAKKSKTRIRKKHTLPPFPRLPDYMVTNVEHRKNQLEEWLQMLLHIPINRNHHETAEFLEVSRYSFVNDLGGKHTEGFVKKRPGGGKVFTSWKQCCVKYFVPWSKRWLMVRDTFVAYMDHRTEQIRLVLLIDKDFKVAAGGREADGIPTGLIITNTQQFVFLPHHYIAKLPQSVPDVQYNGTSSKDEVKKKFFSDLHLKCRRLQDTARWKEVIQKSATGPGKIWLDAHRFGSSFPVREKCYGKWFVDARPFMSQAADMMELAREEIFIADWWLSPEIYMKRPAIQGTYWRLDSILKRKAEQGVKIFVLIYKEMEMALGLNSIYTKRTLQALHPNIKVMRHPDHYPGTGTFFWAHHEKLIVVDQLIAFVGGVDLCFGRWDDENHLLTDLGSVQFAGNHQVTQDMSMASGLRALVSAPLTLGPLGLEENEEVTPRDDALGEDQIDGSLAIIEPAIPTTPSGESSVRMRTSDDTTSESRPTPGRTMISVGTIASTPTALDTVKEEENEDVPDVSDDKQEIVFTDKETGGVMVRIWKKVSRPSSAVASSAETPQAAQVKYLRHSTPPGFSAASGDQGGVGDGHRRPPTLLRVVEDAKGKGIRRAFSQSKSPSRVPKELVEKAGPATSFFEKATRSGMDVATAAKKYKEYVDSGAVEKEKHRSQTPPPKRKESRLSRAVGNWKSNRAKRKWKHVLDSDEVTAGYELDWLRLQELGNEDDELDGGVKLWVGKDYVNYIHKDFVEVDMPFHDFIDRGETPRMPWHDIHSVTFGIPARDVARHFIQRWNATKTEKCKDDENYPYLLPKTYENLKVPRMFKNPNFTENVDVQVLRSLSNWSGLINQTEDSIQMAYLSLIANSKHYVYIENQFFVSMIGSNDVLNEICAVLCKRIIRAHKSNENFRVYIMLPLLPGFEGDVGAPGGSSLQAVLHWTYVSLSRGENSLIYTLKQAGVEDPFKYISIGSLRTHEMLCGKLVSELIYIHCKLLIVDDQHVVIGSANINDRSQVGNRDSEVCLLFSDTQKEGSIMDGKPYEAGKFAKSLRIQCMKEHLGLLSSCRENRKSNFKYEVTCIDPVADSFFVDVWQTVARSNMKIYEEVFRSYPTDNVETFEEFQKWTGQMPLAEYSPQQAEERLRDIRGVLVEFPLNFLCKAVLTPGITSKEGLVPNAVFT